MIRFAAALLLALLSSAASAATLTVGVAANVQYAFDELAAAFEKKTGHQIRSIYNSSGKLTAQIIHGAPIDVFLSADMDYPEKVHRAGFAAAPPQPYAHGALVLWTLNDLDLSQWRQVLASEKVRRIAIANPKVAPYGRETVRALAHAGLKDVLKPKLVYGESVSQVNQYTHSRAVDAAFTAKSVVLSPQMRGQGKWIELPAGSYQPITQGFVVLKHGARNNPAAAKQFAEFLRSPAARAILSRYGYLLP